MFSILYSSKKVLNKFLKCKLDFYQAMTFNFLTSMYSNRNIFRFNFFFAEISTNKLALSCKKKAKIWSYYNWSIMYAKWETGVLINHSQITVGCHTDQEHLYTCEKMDTWFSHDIEYILIDINRKSKFLYSLTWPKECGNDWTKGLKGKRNRTRKIKHDKQI